MKISKSTLTKIAVSAGIAATAGNASARQPAPGQKEEPVPEIAICEAEPIRRVMPMQTAEQIFATHDADKNGELSAEEFNKAYAALVLQQSMAAKPARPWDNCAGCGRG